MREPAAMFCTSSAATHRDTATNVNHKIRPALRHSFRAASALASNSYDGPVVRENLMFGLDPVS